MATQKACFLCISN